MDGVLGKQTHGCCVCVCVCVWCVCVWGGVCVCVCVGVWVRGGRVCVCVWCVCACVCVCVCVLLERYSDVCFVKGRVQTRPLHTPKTHWPEEEGQRGPTH